MVVTRYFKAEMANDPDIEIFLNKQPVRWKKTRIAKRENIYVIRTAWSVWFKIIRRSLNLKKREGIFTTV